MKNPRDPADPHGTRNPLNPFRGHTINGGDVWLELGTYAWDAEPHVFFYRMLENPRRAEIVGSPDMGVPELRRLAAWATAQADAIEENPGVEDWDHNPQGPVDPAPRLVPDVTTR